MVAVAVVVLPVAAVAVHAAQPVVAGPTRAATVLPIQNLHAPLEQVAVNIRVMI